MNGTARPGFDVRGRRPVRARKAGTVVAAMVFMLLHAVVVGFLGLVAGSLAAGDFSGLLGLAPAGLLVVLAFLLASGRRGIRTAALVALAAALFGQCALYYTVFFAGIGGDDGEMFRDPAFFLIWLLPTLLPGIAAFLFLCTRSARASLRPGTR
ncbi:hypothetical protein GCM10022221_46980 [Actinocorallia aurea]